MKITKFGHCCLLVEDLNTRILIDPGSFSSIPEDLKNVDFILITHNHPDHVSIKDIERTLSFSPNCKIITNQTVGANLSDGNLKFDLFNYDKMELLGNISLKAFNAPHAEIYKTIPEIENTAILLNDKLYFPGDSFHVLENVEILALPVVAPWLSISDAVDFALEVKPKIAFPVHDANIKFPGIAHKLPMDVMKENNIEFRVFEDGVVNDF